MMRPFFLMDDQIDLLKDVFWEELENGLSKKPEKEQKSSLLMQDSYVTETLNGKGDWVHITFAQEVIHFF